MALVDRLTVYDNLLTMWCFVEPRMAYTKQGQPLQIVVFTEPARYGITKLAIGLSLN